MAQYIMNAVILTLLLNTGTCTLERFHSSDDHVSCTGNLSCTVNNVLCMHGDKEEANQPVMIIGNMSSQTVLRCIDDRCMPCVKVEIDIYVDFSAGNVIEDCDDYNECYDDIDGFLTCDYLDEISEEDSNNKSNEVSDETPELSLCAHVYIDSIQHCVWVKVSIPFSSIPLKPEENIVKLGTLMFSCFNASPESDVNLTAYTVPRYQDPLISMHPVTGCKELRFIEEVKECGVPSMYVSTDRNFSVGIRNGSSSRSYELMVSHNITTIRKRLKGDERYIIPKEHLVPCLCIVVWWSNQSDAVRERYCPFLNRNDMREKAGCEGCKECEECGVGTLQNPDNYLEENIWRLSTFSMAVKDNLLLYNFSAPCNVSAEISLCWKYSHNSHCQELPIRKKIWSLDPQVFDGVKFHPSICIQVKYKDQHQLVKCLPANDSHNDIVFQEEVILHKNAASLCLMEKHVCTPLNYSTHEMPSTNDHFRQNIVKAYLSNRCFKIWNDNENNEVVVCSVVKRQRWLVFGLVAMFCVLILAIASTKTLTKWVKSMTSYSPLGDIFKDRRVWIIYSPDDQYYNKLVRVFAASLMDLHLNVVLDQWHRREMSSIDPMPWYHHQKQRIFRENGIIILLFDEGALQSFKRWISTSQLVNLDPYTSFGAALNCIHADFVDGSAQGHYVVASFGQTSIPHIFNNYPKFRLPSDVKKLLQELAGINRRKLRKNQLDHLSTRVKKKLKEPISKYKKISTSLNKSETPSMNSGGTNAVEMLPLI
ncbi:Hypothetical predicted protein [Pelobates cultripes]|uniref:SEFIR domain-containing protein n=1 Tax=Pelobates cultripes TaxID=61616 RepID=A0AAD1T1D7_PELCU|nr:Hypothetical predicted protein [Pelobates cultripes]